MGNPTTLTDIDGIGPATAEKLEAAGIKTIAALALSEAATLEKLDGMPPGANFAAWIAAAKKATATVADENAVKAKKPEPAPKAPKADKQPTAEPVAKAAKAAPVVDIEAGPVIVVTGPKNGFRRAGFRFERQPRTIALREFGDGIDGLRRVLAILAEPRLTVVCPDKDGVAHSPDGKIVEELIALTAPGGDREIDPENLHGLVERLFGDA